MALVFNAIRGTTSGTPGTGAFTPNAAVSGYRAWSNVPTGWVGMVRYEDGTSWELTWSYWNGTTLSRASTQMFDSSSGSAISLTSSSTAAMVLDANAIMPNIGSVAWRGWIGGLGSGAVTVIGLATGPTVTGTGSSSGALLGTNYLTEQPASQALSATTANAQAGWSTTTVAAAVNTTAGRAGFRWSARFGASTVPTGPRLFVGLTSVTFVANTGEPSALQSANVACFAKDSADTNIQLLVNDGTATNGTKTDTGIALVANAWYEGKIWCDPGSNKIYALLIRTDTGAIFFTSTTTDTPATGALLFPQILGGLNGVNTGTAITMRLDTMAILGGF